MKEYTKNDCLVLCQERFYSDTFIINTISSIGLNVIKIIYTYDYYKSISKFSKDNYGFSIFFYSNIDYIEGYKYKYNTSVYTLKDIYNNYNSIIYKYYNDIINDYNYIKGYKYRFIAFNSTIQFDALKILDDQYNHYYYNENLTNLLELFPDSILPRIYNINNIPVAIEPLQTITLSPIKVHDNKKYVFDNLGVLNDKLALDNRFNLDIKGYTFVIYTKETIGELGNMVFYNKYKTLFKKQRLVLLLLVKDQNEYIEIKKDKNLNMHLEIFEKIISIVDYKSFPIFIERITSNLINNYKNVRLSVDISDTETIDYIDKYIFIISKYQMNKIMHYKAIISEEQEDNLLMYIE